MPSSLDRALRRSNGYDPSFSVDLVHDAYRRAVSAGKDVAPDAESARGALAKLMGPQIMYKISELNCLSWLVALNPLSFVGRTPELEHLRFREIRLEGKRAARIGPNGDTDTSMATARIGEDSCNVSVPFIAERFVHTTAQLRSLPVGCVVHGDPEEPVFGTIGKSLIQEPMSEEQR